MITTEDFITKARKVHGNKYDYTKSFYVNSSTKIIIICKEHGEFTQISSSHCSQKSGCPKCSIKKVGNKNALPKEKESLKNLYPEICKEWSNKNELGPEHYKWASRKSVWWKCNKCSYEWESRIGNRTIQNKGCPACAGLVVTDRIRLSKIRPDLIKEWDFTKNENTPDDVSIHSAKKKWWICSKCGNSWKTEIRVRTERNNNCSKCCSSNGEKRIQKYLEENSIEHKFQYRIPECRNKLPLPFDFAILKENKLIALIEFNGKQHYELGTGYFNSENTLKDIQYRDSIKINYCSVNKIILLVIPYFELNNIENILETFIKKVMFTTPYGVSEL